FERNSDPYGTGGKADRVLDTFDANLFNAILVSRLSPKVLLRADYGRYALDYAAASNSYRERNDDSYSGYLFFQATPKTAAFVQGEYIKIDYDEGGNLDSSHNNYYLGVQMQTSANTRGRFKVGYGMRDDDTTKSNDLLAEAQLDYFFTPKTSFYLQGTRRILETDQIGAQSILSHRVLLGYRQRMSAKWSGAASLFFNRNEYDGTVIIGNRIATDYYLDEFGGRAALGFSPLTWLILSLGYEYRARDSNFDSEDYRSNTVFVRAVAAL
ncbi:MAG: outer membrane beta-barrel protein, partial [Desulfuromonadales bacterium]|nr:outer membrane beta-barrel protein [Desulfuromonadales bacterium]